MSVRPPFYVAIYSPMGTIYEGEVTALTLINDLGPFDVVARHTNFISAIEKNITLYEKEGTKKDISIEMGIVKITFNRVEIFLGIQALPKNFL